MIRNVQARPKWLAMMIIGFAAMLLSASSAAWADSAHNDYDRHWNYGQVQSQSAHDHHVFQKRYHQHGKRRGHEKHHVGYYCRPCNHYFSARDELYDHVAYRHRVPFRHLSVAVSFGAFGWIFFG
jgi:hypothetical protein